MPQENRVFRSPSPRALFSPQFLTAFSTAVVEDAKGYAKLATGTPEFAQFTRSLQICRVASSMDTSARSGWEMVCPAISCPAAAMDCTSANVRYPGAPMNPDTMKKVPFIPLDVRYWDAGN